MVGLANATCGSVTIVVKCVLNDTLYNNNLE